MRKGKVVFDWDGVFNKQTCWVANRIGVPVPNRYSFYDATNITAEQAAGMYAGLFDMDLYYQIPIDEAAKRALRLSCEPYIYSGNINEDMVAYKYNTIQCIYPNLPDDHIILPVSLEKPPLENVDIIVEDGVHYIEQYPDSVQILISQPYNISDTGNFIRVDSLSEAVDLIERLLAD